MNSIKKEEICQQVGSRSGPQIIFIINLTLQARIYNIMSKKNLAPLPIGKSSKKGNKDILANLNPAPHNMPQISAEQSSEEAPRLKKLKKVGQKEKEKEQKQKIISEKSMSVPNGDDESEGEDVQGEGEGSEEHERFFNVDDAGLAQIQEKQKNKGKSKGKGKGKSKGKNAAHKGEQDLGKFLQKHPMDEQKLKNNTSKPKVMQIQTNLRALFQSGAQPQRKIEQTYSKVIEQKQKQKNQSSDSDEDSMEAYRKKMEMARMKEQIMGDLTEQEAYKIAMRQSMKEANIKTQQVPLENYAFNPMKNSKELKKQPMKASVPAPKKQQPAMKQTKKQKKKRSRSKSRKSQKQQTVGPMKGIVYVTTGQFQNYSKNRIMELMEKLGAQRTKDIAKKTNLLLQGSHVQNCYKRRTDQDVRTTDKSVKAVQNGIRVIAYEDLDNFFIQKTTKSLAELMDEDQPKKEINSLDRYVEINKVTSAAKTVALEQNDVEHAINDNKDVTKTGMSVSWTEKYKPKSSQEIIGQVSQVKNLREWLDVWQDVHIRGNKRDVKPHFNSFMPSGTINSNAALLSGDAGLGKTTAARLIATQFGYSVIEYNASDARNKKSVQLISAGRNNMTFLADKSKQMLKTLIIMDEVDGMSSGDRGGIAAIIEMIKKTKVPIICICNDRQSPKIRSLAGHCYDIKFHKPDKRQIAKRLTQIIESEGGTTSTVALQTLVQMLQNDIRQILTYLQVIFKSGHTNINADTISKKCGYKDTSLTINHFEATKRLLSRTMFKDMSISQRIELAFVDSEMVPLMVQENYLAACQKKKMGLEMFRKLVKATQSIARADVIDRTIMRNQNYCLMPNKMYLGCVYPCQMVCQNLGFPKFTQMLGKMSTERKNRRLVKQLKYAIASMATVTGRSLINSYAPMLLNRICFMLNAKDPQTEKIVQFMLAYNITPSTLTEHIVALQYKDRQNLFKDVQTSKKTKLTKMYNKMSQATKFKKKKAAAAGTGAEHHRYNPVLDDFEDDGVEDEEEADGEASKEESISDILVVEKNKKKGDKSKPKKKK